MNTELQLITKSTGKENTIYLVKDDKSLPYCNINNEEQEYVIQKLKNENKYTFHFNRLTHYQVIIFIKAKDSIYKTLEQLRKEGDKTAGFFNRQNSESIVIKDFDVDASSLIAFAEGILLGNYQFIKYKSQKKTNPLQTIKFYTNVVTKKDIAELRSLTEAVYHCRDMVNMPGDHLNAENFAKQITELCKPLGIKTAIFDKSKISDLEMAGLLAVNQGSKNEPTFTTLEWCPPKKKNKKPIVLVGKGIMFDTGGLSLKPPGAMEDMKCDMAGGAAVFGAIYAIAKAKLPVHVIALIPATDNQPGNNAIAPGDIIKMSNNLTVEVLNTDAEGRLVIADALCYAKQFEPSLVIDIATLTGSTSRTFGKYGMAAFESGASAQFNLLHKTGWEVYERIAQLPFWDEYDKEIESDIADIRNIGKSNNAGTITAGKFLERFVNYPWIHLDIAGMAYLDHKDSYRGKGASGVGVRLLYGFVKNYME